MILWRCYAVIITTAHVHSTIPELRVCAGSNTACGLREICYGEDIRQWYHLEIRLNDFCRSTIPQKQFIIITIIKEIIFSKNETLQKTLFQRTLCSDCFYKNFLRKQSYYLCLLLTLVFIWWGPDQPWSIDLDSRLYIQL